MAMRGTWLVGGERGPMGRAPVHRRALTKLLDLAMADQTFTELFAYRLSPRRCLHLSRLYQPSFNMKLVPYSDVYVLTRMFDISAGLFAAAVAAHFSNSRRPWTDALE